MNFKDKIATAMEGTHRSRGVVRGAALTGTAVMIATGSGAAGVAGAMIGGALTHFGHEVEDTIKANRHSALNKRQNWTGK